MYDQCFSQKTPVGGATEPVGGVTEPVGGATEPVGGPTEMKPAEVPLRGFRSFSLYLLWKSLSRLIVTRGFVHARQLAQV